MPNRRRRRTPTFIALATTVIACAVASPLALAVAERYWRLDWARLANAGEAYGATSAVLSALAVAGVAASLLYQARAVRLQQHQLLRQLHQRLLLLIMDDPDRYATAFAGRHSILPHDALRRHLFCVMELNYYYIGFESGLLSEEGLRREALRDLFTGQPGRTFWVTARNSWLNPDIIENQRFARIVDDEYRKALARGPAIPAPPSEPPTAPAAPRSTVVPAVGAVLVGAFVIGWLVGRRRRRPDPRTQPTVKSS